MLHVGRDGSSELATSGSDCCTISATSCKNQYSGRDAAAPLRLWRVATSSAIDGKSFSTVRCATVHDGPEIVTALKARWSSQISNSPWRLDHNFAPWP